MGKNTPARAPIIDQWYSEHLDKHNPARFIEQVQKRYSVPALERLVIGGQRMSRRAAVLALNSLGDYRSNAVIGRALLDKDRGVRTLADSAIRSIWSRDGKQPQRRKLTAIMRLNAAKQYEEAGAEATLLISEAAHIAEAWNQRAIAFYGEGRYAESIQDCKQALELNPYHFAAAAGMGQCYMRLGKQVLALECFQRALTINPDLEAVRANVVYLRKALKRQ